MKVGNMTAMFFGALETLVEWTQRRRMNDPWKLTASWPPKWHQDERRVIKARVIPFSPMIHSSRQTSADAWRYRFGAHKRLKREEGTDTSKHPIINLGISIRSFLLVYADWEKGGVCLRVCMCVCFMTYNYWDMFFVVRSNNSFNFLLGWIKYIVIVIIIVSFTVMWNDRRSRRCVCERIRMSFVGFTLPSTFTEREARWSKMKFILDQERHLHLWAWSLTPWLPGRHLKMTNRSVKSDTLKTFCLLFCSGNFHQNAQH